MKGCCIPAPAPWATTKHAADSRGAINIPETRVASSTTISTDCASAVTTAAVCARQRIRSAEPGLFRRPSCLLDRIRKRARASGVVLPWLGSTEELGCCPHGKRLRCKPLLDIPPCNWHRHAGSRTGSRRKHRHRRREAVVSQIIQEYPPGTLAFRHGVEIPGRTVLRHLCTDEVGKILCDRPL